MFFEIYMQRLLSFAIHIASMSFARTVNNNLVTWNYQDLYLHGMLGYLEMPLEAVRGKCKDTMLEFAPVKHKPNRDFLAAFGYQPPIDFTIVRMHDGESSILTYSLNKYVTERVIAKFIQCSSFQPITPKSSFVNDIEMSAEIIERATYEVVKGLAEAARADFEKVFGMVRYANFLGSYCNVPYLESQRMAAKRFALENVF